MKPEHKDLLVHCENCELNYDYCPECQRKTLADYKAGMLAAAQLLSEKGGPLTVVECGGSGSYKDGVDDGLDLAEHIIKSKAEEL